MADADCEEAVEIENILDEVISDDIIDNIDNNNENSSTNINNNEINQTKVQSKSTNGTVAVTNEPKNQRKRKRYLSQQQQRKNNKNWKMNKLRRQQSENIELEAAVTKANTFNNFDKNSQQKVNSSLKFYKNIKLCRHRSFSAFSKFFLPEKRPRKDLIVPPTKFLLGGNISDPLNLKNIQNEGGLAPTPKSSPITTPPKIEVIIPPNIHDPLHLLDPVDAIEYQKQLTSPIKRKRKTKHRNRHRKKKGSECQGNVESGSTTENISLTMSTKDEAVNSKESNEMPTEKVDEELATIDSNTSIEEIKPIDREKAIRDLRLEFHEGGGGRKRKVSESHANSKVKVRRMESMDKIVSPVIPQPGAWKRVVHPTPSGAPRCSGRNRTRTQSASLSEDISPSEEQKKDGFGQQMSIVASFANTAQCAVETDIQSVFEDDVEKTVEADRDNSTKVQKPQFKNRDAKYQYGNYDRYHGYRNLNEFMDVRLKVFMRYPHLFEGNDILDIGCNAGHITIFVAKNLHPKTITGIDIDSTLIAKCRQNLALYVKIPPAIVTSNQSVDEGDDIKPTTSDAPQKQRQQKLKRKKKVKMNESVNRNYDTRQQQLSDEFFPISFPKCYGQIPQSPSASNDASQSVKDEPILFPKNIFFKTNNYVLKNDSMLNQDSQQYDLILCLSVTKWIHLNFGDAGLKITFKRIFNQLRPGGKLVLEAQNWASYKKKKKLTENIYNNFKNIEFYPNKFHEYLLGPEVGFSHSYPLGVPRHLNKGFRRPIQLYIKGDFTPSQKHWSDTYYPQTPYAQRGIYAEPLYMGQMMPGSKSMWGNDTPHGNYSYRFTPSQNFSATSQYYNPYETDSYLPSYNQEIQTRQYCFQSPLYLTIWSPPSGRNSQSHTPVYGSVRETDGNEHNGDGAKKHVYPPTDGLDDVGKSSNRSSENDVDKSPQVKHVYLNTYNESSSGTDTNSNQKCDTTTPITTISTMVSQDKFTNINEN